MSDLFYDVIVLAVLLLALWRGYRKGFILTLFGFLAVFVALIGASLVSNTLAEPVAQSIQPVVEQRLLQSLEQAMQDPDLLSSAPELGTAPALEEIPLSGVLDALRDSQLFAGLADAFENAVDDGLVQVTSNAVRALADYVAIQIAHAVLFLLTFVVILILWTFLSHALDLVARLPVLNALNRWAGAGVGLLMGCLLMFAAVWVLRLLGLLTEDIYQQTTLLRFFCVTDPLALIGGI